MESDTVVALWKGEGFPALLECAHTVKGLRIAFTAPRLPELLEHLDKAVRHRM